MPAPSVAVRVTASEPSRAPPASRPEAATVGLGGVGSLIVTSEPCSVCVITPSAVSEQGELRLKQPTRRISWLALPAYAFSAGKLCRVTALFGTATLASG
jgi:hypothetical protein